MNLRDALNLTPLPRAAFRGFAMTCQLLIAAGADPNVSDEQGQAALHAAAARGSLPLAELLIASNADPNLVDKRGDTPLFESVRFDDEKMTSLLLRAGACAETRNSSGETPLELAKSASRATLNCVVKYALQARKVAVIEFFRGTFCAVRNLGCASILFVVGCRGAANGAGIGHRVVYC